MARKIKWSVRALDDLVQLAEFIERDSSFFAAFTVKRIVSRLEQAAAFPRSGRIVPEKNLPNLRELFWKEYRLV
ncbi:MAG: type II toxin-antitoxin system RelE/ParE family toxin [Candidatus Acidiferrales bacterium]